ncbi:G-type lectin S-receptor-like serine/threonine-protein kinase At1g11330 isoform X1 [Cornus florida]|uniref:G-type lectin S-receptor-like serine/threonine-protein kinase At1g11330 isoform X1 n=1 Tax=Cornus florida TaxID=4283 RepID=UPI0028A16BFB|nr:G-type lectin S-receptor-like serine/threonine-protein kinase At1g11330 isoform X1 [Cornus florida]
MTNSNKKLAVFLSTLQFIHISLLLSCLAIDTISKTQHVLDGQTMVSEGEVFELGFFSPNESHVRYLAIWYRGLPVEKVVWVANRDNPLTDTSGVLVIGRDGNLVLIDDRFNTVWSTKLASVASNDTIAVLRASGNLVLIENNSNGSVLWESFSHPSDTLLPGMKLGLNTKTGESLFLTSCKSDKDPSPGNFVLVLEPRELPESVILNGTIQCWRSGQWNGRSFIGLPGMNTDYLTGFNLVEDNQAGTIYFVYSLFNGSLPSVLFLSSLGAIIQKDWNAETREWVTQVITPNGPCDIYGTCGSFGICNDMNSPICNCLSGYVPKSSEEWHRRNWTGGCIRRVEIQCERNSSTDRSKSDGFIKLTGIKLPDFSDYSSVDGAIQCGDFCLKNCSCVAYAYVNGIGCMVWGGHLIDVREFSNGGEDLHLRLAYSELGEKRGIRGFIIILIVISTILGLGILAYILCRVKTLLGGARKCHSLIIHKVFSSTQREISTDSPQAFLSRDDVCQEESSELPYFNLEKIAAATENFSLANKLGEGGFGPVYKGKLPSGQELAVKRLSKSSGQGIEEFKNEVILISKLQHRNLVKLLGFCIEGEEKLLLYEFMPNRSLDAFLFGSSKKAILNWDQISNIIEGIARGLLYLHRDSRLRIIHRDLKASNILLDEDMNPKISDFGMARIFRGNQTLANTNRVVGTYGYMSPEYAMEGIFSEKSDVFSFGVLLLEIISGKRNTGFYHHEIYRNLLGYAWDVWNKGKALELLDSEIANSISSPSQVLRCIHVGLLCVQEQPNDRPSMATIVFILCNDTTLPTPKQPAFILERSTIESNLPLPDTSACSINYMSTTTVEGR